MRSTARGIFVLIPALVLAGCTQSEHAKAIENGLCVEKNTYLTDADFIEIALQNWSYEAWKGFFPNPKAFVAVHPDCCSITRHPRREDWRRGMDEQQELASKIERHIASEKQTDYVVFVRIMYLVRDTTGTMREEWYAMSSCGVQLASSGLSRRPDEDERRALQ